MGIEFINQPPKKVEDFKLDDQLEIIADQEGGDEARYFHVGASDFRALMFSTLQTGNPDKDSMDFELFRQMLTEVSQDLSDAVRVPYLKGVDSEADKAILISTQGF